MRSNAATIMFEHPLRDPAPSPEDAFRAAWPTLAALRAQPEVGPRLAIVAVHASGDVRSAVVGSDRFLVIGRHTRCALVLDDPEVSLRHLVAHWSDDEGDAPTLRLWDLRTGQPFVTEDGLPSSSVVAEGVLFASLGRYQLLLVPLDALAWSDDADAAWASLPVRRFASARVARDRVRSRDRRDSTVTHTLPPIVFGAEILGGPDAKGRVTVELPDGRTERWVSDEQLDRGLLFGRYDRCQLALDGDDALSRVHLFVVRVDDRVWAIDTASTNGTRHNGVPVAASALSSPASLLLARRCVVHWAAALGPS
jgi:pSer/pThr/pTyr-binding forkhead associated (FHA) protein